MRRYEQHHELLRESQNNPHIHDPERATADDSAKMNWHSTLMVKKLVKEI